jgi:hypothetical protein
MSKTWKWILGILLVLVIVAGMFAIGYTWRSRMAYAGEVGIQRTWEMPMYRPWSMQGPGEWNHPMMARRGIRSFGGFHPLAGLLQVVVFFGLLYGAYWLGRRNARITVDPQPTAKPVTEPESTPPQKKK